MIHNQSHLCQRKANSSEWRILQRYYGRYMRYNDRRSESGVIGYEVSGHYVLT